MLRRTPLKRKVGLKRTRFKRSRPKPNPAGSDKAHLAWVRAQPCVVCGTSHKVEAHHPRVGAGMSRKAPDRDAFPMCAHHHRVEFHGACGHFEGWTKAQRHEWQRGMSALYCNGENTV